MKKSIIITGSSGFIGTNLFYNYIGQNYKIVLSDRRENIHGESNLIFFDPEQLVNYIKNNVFTEGSVLFHQGACSNTMESDKNYIMNENFNYSKQLLEVCLEKRIKFIYASSASVYGDSKFCIEDSKYENPLNLYAESKLLFDEYVRLNLKNFDSNVVGLRYFNVYGPFEYHKGVMASQIFNQFLNIEKYGYVEIFGGHLEVNDGEQKRDFIYVKDIVLLNNFFMKNNISGIFNAGSGYCETFNSLSVYLLNSKNKSNNDLDFYLRTNCIKYKKFPENLIGKYQNNTWADLTNLNKCGYFEKMNNLKEGISDYYNSHLVKINASKYI